VAPPIDATKGRQKAADKVSVRQEAERPPLLPTN
jgi:hypothetical protein